MLVRSWKYLILQSKWTHTTPVQSDSANCANLLLWVVRVYRNEEKVWAYFGYFFSSSSPHRVKVLSRRDNIVSSTYTKFQFARVARKYNLESYLAAEHELYCASNYKFADVALSLPHIVLAALTVQQGFYVDNFWSHRVEPATSHSLGLVLLTFSLADDIRVDCWVRSDFNWKIVECGKNTG